MLCYSCVVDYQLNRHCESKYGFAKNVFRKKDVP